MLAGEVGRTDSASDKTGIAGSGGLLHVARLPHLILAGASLFYLHVLVRGSVPFEGRVYFTLFDDAMISLRYAKTLAAGGGFTWNPGETPIEGITNPLWTLWMALLHLLPIGEGFVPLLVGLSSAACLIATALAARRLARHLGASDTIALLAMAFVAFYYPLAFWSLRGMETGILACLMAWSMVLMLEQMDEPTHERSLLLAAMAVALIWVRQDATIFVAVIAGFALLAGGTKLRSTAAALIIALVAALALLTLFRLAYYGEALPNTYYLKVTGVTLAERLSRGAAVLLSEEMRGHLIIPAVVLALSLPALAKLQRKAQAAFALPLAVFAAQAAYSVYVGGDVWELMGYPNRYIVIAMPGLIAVGIVLIGGLGERLARTADEAHFSNAIIAALAGLLFLQTSAKHAFVAFRDGPAYVDYDRAATQVGLCLREHTPPGTRIAYTWAGSMAYFADRHGIDLLGKMDAHIARAKPQIAFEPGHNKWDYPWSVDTHKPDIVLQLFRAKPGDHEAIRARGYDPVARDWPCLANTFLAHEDVFVRSR